MLGFMYATGQGVPQDYAEAVRWYRPAAQRGLAYAQYNLGISYVNGQGVARDYTEALKWFHRAAVQNHQDAQYALAAMYANGQSVPQDFVKAHMWLGIAAMQGHEGAARYRGILAKRMILADISKAQRLAREWMEKHGKK